MATSNHTTSEDGFKPPSTPLEAYLHEVHGDLHAVIPALASRLSLPGVAGELSSEKYNVSATWVRNWLTRNNYRRIVRWERQAVDS